MSTKILAESVRPNEVWAWAMYDFANSGYTTVVITAVFNAYFVAVVAQGKDWGTFAWSAALALSYFLIMVTAPAVGAYADAFGVKKKLLFITTVGCVAFTAALALVGKGDLYLAIMLVVISNYFYGSGENLIAAFLPELAQGDAMGKVSGWGWSIGFIGGLVSLGAALAYISWAQGEGQVVEQFVPITMLITAGLFALSSLPTFLILKERAVPQPHLVGRGVVAESLARLGNTLHHARRYHDLARFLLCLVFYQAGIQAVIALAAIYAEQAMHFGTQETIKLVLLVNITAAAGAFVFGHYQDRLGHVRAIGLTLLGWMLMIVIAYYADTPGKFWLAANIAGLCLGSSQSAGRALVGYLSPRARTAEFFGLWGLAVKLSSILGPLTYGLVSWISRGDHRLSMLITGSYFLAGLLLLKGVNAERGRHAALAED
ncbi:MAG: MFS transporter [Sulfuricella sp.]|nr:MFS transporter [Sulfuricella sp.]